MQIFNASKEIITRQEALQVITNDYGFTSAPTNDIVPFISFGSYENLNIKDTFLVAHFADIKAYLLILEYDHIIASGSRRVVTKIDTSNYFFGVISGIKDIGQFYIRPETIRDKINEWYSSLEVDYEEDPHFSKLFYVLKKGHSTDPQQLSLRHRKMISKFTDCELEFYKGNCLFRINRSSISLDNLAELILFIKHYLQEIEGIEIQ